MIVQSTVKDPKRLDSRVESFLSSHRDNLLKMTETDFKEKVKTLIRMKREKYKNLNEECAFYIKEISDGTLLFDRVEIEISALEALEKEDLLKFYDQKIASGAPDRRKLSIQIYSSQHAPGIITEQKTLEDSHTPVCPSSSSIKDIPTFKLSQSFYGLPPPHN